MRVRMPASLSPEPLGASVRTHNGPGRVVDYACPGGVIMLIVELDSPDPIEDVLDEQVYHVNDLNTPENIDYVSDGGW